MITILGPTATGKTRLAAKLASIISGEIISADSRQVFRKMDIGTGKDLEDYIVAGIQIPFHLIDIAEPGTEFSVYDFYTSFELAFNQIVERNKSVILCGGTGLYLESAIKGYNLPNVPVNKDLRSELSQLSENELICKLEEYKILHNSTDTNHHERLLRAIEIQDFKAKNPLAEKKGKDGLIFGIEFDRETIRNRISERLHLRLNNGLIDEVKKLADEGVTFEMLHFYGLEYRYIAQYLLGKTDYKTMFALLETAIHQFAKRQMTWFRRMEKNGLTIHWIDGNLTESQKIEYILELTSHPIS